MHTYKARFTSHYKDLPWPNLLQSTEILSKRTDQGWIYLGEEGFIKAKLPQTKKTYYRHICLKVKGLTMAAFTLK